MKIYGLSNCDTCRRARKSLPDAEFIDVRVDGISADELQTALDTFGDKLVNTRSTTWRGLNEDERKRPALELLQSHPALMKRPLIDVSGKLYLGWTPEVQAALVGV